MWRETQSETHRLAGGKGSDTTGKEAGGTISFMKTS